MILNIIPDTDPILHNRVPDYDFASQTLEEREQLCRDMRQTLEVMEAYGLAANQCGLPYRVFVIRDTETEPLFCFNPTILAIDEQEEKSAEGCLSFPNLWLEVERPIAIEAEWYDIHGVRHERTFREFQAKGFCHEFDHLNGVVFTSRVSKLALTMAKNAMKKEKRKKSR